MLNVWAVQRCVEGTVDSVMKRQNMMIWFGFYFDDHPLFHIPPVDVCDDGDTVEVDDADCYFVFGGDLEIVISAFCHDCYVSLLTLKCSVE